MFLDEVCLATEASYYYTNPVFLHTKLNEMEKDDSSI